MADHRVRVLVACEESGKVRDAFRARGHDAWSCDLEPCRADPAWHIQGDVRPLLRQRWDLLIAFPPCTYLASSGLHWNHRRPGRAEKTEEALAFVREIDAADIPRRAFENPIGCLSTRWREPDQIIHPWMFGHRESKTTCLWLHNLPLIRGTLIAQPDYYVWPDGAVFDGDEAEMDALVRADVLVARWANQTASGQNRLSPSPTRQRDRSETYSGVADAFAEQWGALQRWQQFAPQIHRQPELF